MDWPYFSVTPWLRSIEQEFGDGMFEIVVLVSRTHSGSRWSALTRENAVVARSSTFCREHEGREHGCVRYG